MFPQSGTAAAQAGNNLIIIIIIFAVRILSIYTVMFMVVLADCSIGSA